MNLNELDFFLKKNTIPKIKRNPKTFLGIAKQPHYENVLSNIYAFYFNAEEEHNLKDLFIVSLHEIITSKTSKDVTFTNNFEIETEYSTKKGGRIDLLLSTDDEAIIIENKVYHLLNNDLNDYWNTIKTIDDNKVGIILSLRNISDTGHKHFINITHLELLKKVMENIGGYLLKANDKYLIFLKDLYQNITNLSKSFMEKKDLEFYFKNQEEINQIAKFKFDVRDHIANEVENACDRANEEFKLYKSKGNLNKRLRYFLSPNNKNLMFTVIYDKLLTDDKELKIIIELQKSALKDKKRYEDISFSIEEKSLLNETFQENKNKAYAHFAVKKYTLVEDEIINLSDFIVEKIEEDKLLSIYRKLDVLLRNKVIELV